jgi:UPF0755 protein
MRIIKIVGIIFFLLLLICGVLYYFFGPESFTSEEVIFTVPTVPAGFDAVAALAEQKIVKNIQGFQFLYLWFSGGGTIKPGGYRLNKNMNAWQVMGRVTGKPDLLWVTISGCRRKEEIGEKLANVLGWTSTRLDEWNSTYSDNDDYKEGVYYPDSYLIPADEPPAAVAKRFLDRFNEKFAPLADAYIAKNIKWTTGLKIASLIGRESGGVDDMKLISGIIWNRLDKDMPLQIDATMQYTQGKHADPSASSGQVWWGPVDLVQKQSDSPYNSYLKKGLPPTPICSPSIEELDAALNPAETDCLFYLHDRARQIHCAKTYAEHKLNIEKYLNTDL